MYMLHKLLQHTATHCHTMQHSATHCNTLQHTATHYNTLQHAATHCNTLQRIHHGMATMHELPPCTTLQHIATHCNTLQRTATHCNTFLATRRLPTLLEHTTIGVSCTDFLNFKTKTALCKKTGNTLWLKYYTCKYMHVHIYVCVVHTDIFMYMCTCIGNMNEFKGLDIQENIFVDV